jgi:hypothetical protein
MLDKSAAYGIPFLCNMFCSVRGSVALLKHEGRGFPDELRNYELF